MNQSLIRFMRPHVAEFIGTFALVFIGCGTIATGNLDVLGGAVAFGGTLGIMVYALGHISGGHFNPAVSVGLAVGRRFPWTRVPTYVIAQAAGATVAALLLRLTLSSGAPLGVTHPSGSDGQAFVWEVVMTFFLVFVVTAVATDARAVRAAAGFCIGGTVVLDALDKRCFNEPGSVLRSGARRQRLHRPVDLPGRTGSRRCDCRDALHVPARREVLTPPLFRPFGQNPRAPNSISGQRLANPDVCYGLGEPAPGESDCRPRQGEHDGNLD